MIKIINMPAQSVSPDWLSAEAALARLGVARQTLYAYVSRGLVRTCRAMDDPRRSLYDPRSIDALLERRGRGRARRVVAASTIDFGEPVLVSRITQIANGTLLYRGHDAIALAQTATLEETAALLWEASPLPDLADSGFVPCDGLTPLARCLHRIASLPSPSIWSRSPAVLIADAATLLRRIAEAATNTFADGPLHQALAQAWGVDTCGAGLIRRGLVLCADHELNASTFAVRVVASTGAALPACLLAGLAALTGPLHGGMTERVAAFLAEPGMAADPRGAIEARLSRGDRLPGFGHRLYPDGDPRAEALLADLELGPWWRAMLRGVRDLTGLRPNIDLALVALERECRLPSGSALAIFAIGRAVGWIAHALEQNADGQLIRPRATYAAASSGRDRQNHTKHE
ncbi:MAG TPA: citrate synthase [Acetobacteraceae bacterium]|nr:citrate synthase [Acetobacteraceae bacterium]